tara:strand:+ start:25 stop:258 length:234 start_codon:yes stop_codon:yes gene_type:complete
MPKYNQLDKDMLRMMTVTERFNYINYLKQMQMEINTKKLTEEDPRTKEWVDEDNNEWDGWNDGSDNSSDDGEDSNEY